MSMLEAIGRPSGGWGPSLLGWMSYHVSQEDEYLWCQKHPCESLRILTGGWQALAGERCQGGGLSLWGELEQSKRSDYVRIFVSLQVCLAWFGHVSFSNIFPMGESSLRLNTYTIVFCIYVYTTYIMYIVFPVDKQIQVDGTT